jgi:hypothetical protein
MFKLRIFVQKLYTMGCLGGRAVPVLYIGRTVPKGYQKTKFGKFRSFYRPRRPFGRVEV